MSLIKNNSNEDDFEQAKNYFLAGLENYEKQNYEEAEKFFRLSLQIIPDRLSTLTNLAATLIKLKKRAPAEELISQLLDLYPDDEGVHLNNGNFLQENGRWLDSIASYDKAIGLKADYAEAYSNRGLSLQALKRYDEALASYDKAIELKSDYVEAYSNRGLALEELHRCDEALASYDQAIKIKADYAEAYINRGNTLQELKRLDEALASYDRAIRLKANFDFLYGTRLHVKRGLCDWLDAEKEVAVLSESIEHNKKAAHPFPVLALIDSLATQRKAAEIFVNEKHPENRSLLPIAKRPRHTKIRIGYYSADYHNHATACLMAELFERHDKNKFELIAFSFGVEHKDRMRKRISAAFDRFLDVRDESDKDVALLSRTMEIDIAVDLKGFTQHNRVGIFSYRAAPIQVNYIGYPGTMGAAYIDYIIADSKVIPEDGRQHYSEKIVCLPNSYQVNDRKRQISEKSFSRETLGLPQTGFVFCCFNNNFKITPGIFDVWMRILKRVNGSVLWLLEDNTTAAENLRLEAGARGVNAQRLIFARRMPLAEHLARHRAADLFIDTLPYNAHTTASDALWAGLPVLTCVGESFAGRVAASLLNAIDLSELITTTQEQYEALAVELATNPDRLSLIKQKLERNRMTTPLFDSALFTKHIEAAYTQMYERYHADLPPEHFNVKA